MNLLAQSKRFVVLALCLPLYAWSYEIVDLSLIHSANTYKKTGHLEVIFDASRQHVYEVITDFENFADFMPRNEEVRILRQAAGFIDLQIKIDMPFPISNIEYGNHVELYPDEFRTVFSMIPESSKDVVDFSGGWTLTEAPEGKTLAVYEILFVGKKRYPSFIENKATRSSLEKIAKAIDQQIQVKKQTNGHLTK